jgi:PadR family transcriptional regulator PadR
LGYSVPKANNKPVVFFLLTIYPSAPTLGRMTTQDRTDLLQGTLDLLILRTLRQGRQHGQGVARAILQNSREMLLVEHGSLYPALQRLEANGWIRAEWGVSENNRRARFYELTKDGKQQLAKETGDWHKLVRAIGFILGPEAARG